MKTSSTSINPKMLELMVCPLTKGPLFYCPKRQALVSPKAKLAYPVRNGIPVMIVDEAQTLEEE